MRKALPTSTTIASRSVRSIIDELEPGDLYIPPGFPHEGYALENAMNYSVITRPMANELIQRFADYVLQAEVGANTSTTAIGYAVPQASGGISCHAGRWISCVI